MAIEITARMVVTKANLEAAGFDPTDDEAIKAIVHGYLFNHLPAGWDPDQFTVGIQRKVKKNRAPGSPLPNA